MTQVSERGCLPLDLLRGILEIQFALEMELSWHELLKHPLQMLLLNRLKSYFSNFSIKLESKHTYVAADAQKPLASLTALTLKIYSE